MKYLIESFYHSIVADAPVPISYREIRLTSRIMDAIFNQLNATNSGAASEERRPEADGERVFPSEDVLESIPRPRVGYFTNR